MNDKIRTWMRLVEATGGQTVRVYHGSHESTLTLHNGILYGVRDFGFAASYAVERGRRNGGTGYVHTLDFHFRQLATDSVIDSIAKDLDIDISQSSPVNVVDKDDHQFEPDILDALHEYGYNGITGYDFGFRSDFEQLMVWAVFNAANQVTPVAVTPVTRADLQRRHAPD